jgi:hypothetical protein
MDTALVEQLRREEHALLARLAAVRQMLDVYANGQMHQKPAPVAESPAVMEGSPSLSGLRIRDAISIYLGFCREKGRDRITIGEMFAALSAGGVTTFRGKPLNETKFPFKTVCNSLGSPENRDVWVIEKRSDHYQRGDTIALKTEKRKAE